MLRALRCAGVSLLALPALAAPPRATITFVDGDATLLSAGRAFVPANGVRLRSCDALHTGAKGMVQVEFDDGSAVLLGPDTRIVFDLPATGAAPGQVVQFLHSGWAKVTAPRRPKAPQQVILTPAFDLALDDGVAVLRMSGAVAQFFVERGAATALEPAAPGPARAASVRAGFTFTRQAGQTAGTLVNGAEHDFARAVPRSLRDTLPMRLAALKERDVAPQVATTHADHEDWLTSAPQLRGCSSDAGIRRAQEILTRKGYDIGVVDGVIGPRTEAALRNFQEKAGLAPSGRLDAETLRALDSAAGN
jgi:hypothetical protein